MPVTGMQGLQLRRGRFVDPATRDAQARLLDNVLGIDVEDENRWTSFALFEPGGQCIANVDAAVLELVLDGCKTQASGIRSVAVDPDWRGRGLFRAMMIKAIGWCRPTRPTFLYTAEPALYERFGFQTVPQHAFVGAPPASASNARARRLDLGVSADVAKILTLVARRTPVSSHCALGVDASLFLRNVAKDEALTIALLERPEALIVYETDDDGLVIADIVAEEMPDLATVLGALGLRPSQVTTLFPTDKLKWQGTAQAEDTGLMMLGGVSGAMGRPFMFSPMSEF